MIPGNQSRKAGLPKRERTEKTGLEFLTGYSGLAGKTDKRWRMTRQELLKEQYEDALFALLMDNFSAAQGKAAWEENERLKRDPAAAVPLPVQQRCLKQISRHFSRQYFRSVGRTCSRVVNRIAIVALISILLLTTAFAISPTLRSHALNLMISTLDDRTNLQFFAESKDSQTSENLQIVANWLPDGYVLDSQKNDSRGTWNQYRSQNEQIIQIDAAIRENSIVSIDTEDADTDSITIHDNKALLSQKDDTLQIAWLDQLTHVLWTIYGEGISKSDIIQIAENVELIGCVTAE